MNLRQSWRHGDPCHSSWDARPKNGRSVRFHFGIFIDTIHLWFWLSRGTFWQDIPCGENPKPNGAWAGFCNPLHDLTHLKIEASSPEFLRRGWAFYMASGQVCHLQSSAAIVTRKNNVQEPSCIFMLFPPPTTTGDQPDLFRACAKDCNGLVG